MKKRTGFYKQLMVGFDSCDDCGEVFYFDETAKNAIAEFASSCPDEEEYECWLVDCETDEELATFTVSEGYVEIDWV